MTSILRIQALIRNKLWLEGSIQEPENHNLCPTNDNQRQIQSDIKQTLNIELNG